MVKKPAIIIDGTEHEIQKIKPKQWREFFKFDTERGEMPLEELLEKHCEVIADFFDEEITPEYLLENMDISDVLKVYHEIRTHLMELVTIKLGADSKNAKEDANQE